MAEPIAADSTGERTWTVIVAGSPAALGRALSNATHVSPPERTLVVVTARQLGGLEGLPPGRAHVLVEPLDRGTAATILFPMHWIHARDPQATVVVFGDDPPWSVPGLGYQVAQVARSGAPHVESLLLLGLPAGGDGRERAAIVPGERIGSAFHGPLFRVRDLVDPSPDGRTERPFDRVLTDGALVMGRATAFIEAAAQHVTALNERLARAVTFTGQEHERWALRQAYALAPGVDFFRSILRPMARALAVLEIQAPAVSATGVEDQPGPRPRSGAARQRPRPDRRGITAGI